FLPQGDVLAAANLIFPAASNPSDLDERMKKIARGRSGPQPEHIFVIVMESYDGWAMLPEYQSLGLTRNLTELAQAGVSVKAFVSSGESTMKSLAVIVSGL